MSCFEAVVQVKDSGYVRQLWLIGGLAVLAVLLFGGMLLALSEDDRS